MPDFDLKRLRGRKLFVGTPMYDGRCHSEFAFSIVRLTALCTQLEIDLRFLFVGQDALITKARNKTVDEFLLSGYQNLVFIDSDIGFDAKDVLHLLAFQIFGGDGHGLDVIAAPYPLKRLSWAMVLQAAKSGMADDDPESLGRVSSPIAISPVRAERFPIDIPIEVAHAGTGFMMIRRETFEQYKGHHPKRGYRVVERIGLADETSGDIYAFFETEIDSKQSNIAAEVRAFLSRSPEATPDDVLAFLDNDVIFGTYTGNYFSEDFAFCRGVREAGMKVWLCPWMELTHTGSHRFASRLADLHAIGAT
jgi:hypothetical protein